MTPESVRCPTCSASLPLDLLWAADESRCRYCQTPLSIPDVLSELVAPALAEPTFEPVLPFADVAVRLGEKPAHELDLERALETLEQSAIEVVEEASASAFADSVLTNDLRRVLADLGVALPPPGAPRDEVERALADARRVLTHLDDEPSRDR